MLSDLIDIGANLTHDAFDEDRDAVLERAAAAGVGRIVVTGASEAGSRDAVALARRYPQLHATAGVHPHEADRFTDDTQKHLLELAGAPEVVAMGECGLDYYRGFSSRENQQRCFAAQLELARETGKPVFLHQRDAHEPFLEVLDRFLPDLSRVVVHCFTGGQAELEAYLERDCYVGVTGWICDERRGRNLKEIVGRIPADRLMVETDAPYLLPRDLKPKPKSRRNEPHYLPHIIETIAEASGKPAEQVGTETTQTAKRFFGIQ
jgi:TatD DNase family protein